MKQVLLMLVTALFLSSCATWQGVKDDSSDAWEATKDTSSDVYNKTKKSIHNITE